jgi:ribokinase
MSTGFPGVPIVVLGSLNMDLVLEVARAPEGGETLSGRSLRLIPGGKGANQAVACARLGGRVAMIGRVGRDEFGDQLRKGLAQDDIVLDYLSTDDQAHTGVALIMVDDSAQNRIVIVPGANGAFTSAQVDQAEDLLDQAELVLLQLEIPLPSVTRAIERAARAGKKILLNPAPAQPLPAQWWAHIHYLVPNETEATLLTGIHVTDPSAAAAAARELQSRGVRNVLVTLGPQGVLIADSQGARHYNPPSVKAVDTTAAGDTFIGGLAVGLTEGMQLDDAAKFAMRAASLSVTRVGAQTSIPYRSEVC